MLEFVPIIGYRVNTLYEAVKCPSTKLVGIPQSMRMETLFKRPTMYQCVLVKCETFSLAHSTGIGR